MPLVAVVSKTTDANLQKTILVLWKGCVSEINVATALVKLESEQPSAASPTTPTSRLAKLPAVPCTLADTLIDSGVKLQAALSAAAPAIDSLRDANAALRRTSAEQQDKRFLEILIGLDTLLVKCSTAASKLSTSFVNDPLKSLDSRQVLLADTQLFVHSVTRMLAIARIVSTEVCSYGFAFAFRLNSRAQRTYSESVLQSIAALSRAVKDITRLIPIDWCMPGGQVSGSSPATAASPTKLRLTDPISPGIVYICFCLMLFS